MSEFKCPKCGSENIQKCEIIYAHGTSNMSATTTGTTTIGEIEAQTTGQSSTNLAQLVAPSSSKTEYWGATIIAGIVTFIFVRDMFNHHFSFGGIVLTAIVAIATFIFYSISQEADNYNKNEYPKAYKEWQNSYLCHRCGNRFLIK